MVPRLAAAGSSFQGAFLYYGHDKGARTRERVEWSHTVNMMTESIEKAWKVMAFTAKNQASLKEASGHSQAGAKLRKPVLSYSLSWHPEQKPDKETMLQAAHRSLEYLGLSEHEAWVVRHRDEPQPHVHVVANTVHPLTGMVAKLKYTKRKLQDWAREFQREEGTMYCPKREENFKKRQEGQRTKYADPCIVAAWEGSSDGRGFQTALEDEGYDLAQGRKRLVVVDRYGKTINPVRHLEGVTTKVFNDRVVDLDFDSLPTPEAVLESRRSKSGSTDTKAKEYEERVAAALNNQASRHHEEWASVSSHHHRLIDAKRTELTVHYQLDERQEQIDTLKQKLTAPNRLSKFALRFFRWDKRIAHRIGTLQATQDNARQRLTESLGHLEQRRRSDLKELELRQKRDREELIARLEKWRPPPRSRDPERADHRGPDVHEQANEGRSLGR